MPEYTFECFAESHRHDIIYSVSELPRIKACPECGGDSRQVFDHQVTNLIHQDVSGAGYGKFWPSLGQVVTSVSHKKALMRELDCYEANDPVNGSRCHVPSEFREDGNNAWKRKRNPQGMTWSDKPKKVAG
jgi:hypothetical protein